MRLVILVNMDKLSGYDFGEEGGDQLAARLVRGCFPEWGMAVECILESIAVAQLIGRPTPLSRGLVALLPHPSLY